MLHNIRYDLDGSHYNDNSTESSVGCSTDGCNGYELTQDLDFNDSATYGNASDCITANSWEPIGDSSNSFDANFDGNDYTISNLCVNKTSDNASLFGRIYPTKSIAIKNLTISNAKVVSTTNYAGILSGRVEVEDKPDVILTIEKIIIAGGAVEGAQVIGGLIGRADKNSDDDEEKYIKIINSSSDSLVLRQRIIQQVDC